MPARGRLMEIDLPEVVRNTAVAAGAEGWLAELPALVGGLTEDWDLTIGEPFGGGTEAFVVRVDTADHGPAVLKVLVPRSGIDPRHEITFLRLADGEGCPQLYQADAGRHALLMERLGPPMSDLGLPLEDRHRLLCAAAQRVWRPAPSAGFPTGAEKGEWLIRFIRERWTRLDRPCAERTIEHAVEAARRRIAAHDEATAVMVHGDVQEWNALRAGDGFELVDPDGLLAEPEYDLGVIMREDPAELLADDDPTASSWRRAHRLAAWTGRSAAAAWEWGVVERVSTGLLCEEVGLQPVGRQMLDVADHLAR